MKKTIIKQIIALFGVALFALTMAMQVSAASTVNVTPSNLNGWYFYNDQNDAVLSDSADHGFVTGPGTPLIGTGSVHLTKTTNDSYGIVTGQFAGTALSNISSLSYSTYRASGTAAQAPSLGFDIDTNSTSADTVYEGRLTYEPYFTQTVSDNTWQTWNTLNDTAGTGTGNWWFSHANTGLPNQVVTACTQSDPCTWAQVLQAFPNAQIRNPGQLILRTNGATNEVFNGNVDNLTIGISGNNTVFNFDPNASTVTVTIDKYIDGNKATAVTANNSAFPMASSWTTTNIGSGSGTYALDTSDSYEAVTSNMSSGSSYSTNEVTGGSVVGASCSTGQPYMLAGYSSGDSLADAQAAPKTTTAPSLTNITTNKYVIVWNKPCAPVPPPVTVPTNMDQCKDGGWKGFSNPSFKNQGQCVSYVQANEKAGKKN